MSATTSRKTKTAEEQVKLDRIFNFRRVDDHGHLYRSARQDAASPADIQHLHNLGIRTYLDLRTGIEYHNSLGHRKKPIDDHVQVLEPVLPNADVTPYPTTDSIPMKGINVKSLQLDGLPMTKPRRYLINMFPKPMILAVFNSVSLLRRLLSLVVLIVDVILGNHYKYFVRCFSKEISSIGLVGRYVSILEHGGRQLCFILHTLTDPENLPALICCAHGKDRTGLVTAMVLTLLGKSDEYIAQDYARSEEGLRHIQESVREETSLKYNVDDSFAWAKKETMMEVLRILRERYGSVEDFLESRGFTKEDQKKLCHVLS
ncbi:uncharacterized protein LOC110983526 isoform X1 [Acanthaster planci]|uniref:Uncharacterized protein LOC110983526 isoform X1 n=1 Tax=Acanthaster planci TaxID=133434 RepID=A0A8B7YYV7_ACAPL|nr:uncharacterized protein LOC110983526 isoform X1 [Acanthaster planci]